MKIAGRFFLTGAILLGSAISRIPAQGQAAPAKRSPATPEQIEFFEKRVRPVLAENCYQCHGSRLQQGGVRLDTPEMLLRMTAKGSPAITPGSPERSALIKAIRYDGAVKMPPSGKLKPAEIEGLTQWVKMGAPWPAAKVNADNEAWALSAAGKHWAFQPVQHPPLPPVKNEAWVQSPIDRFILAKLEAQGLKPARPADRRTLLRRVTYDLIGLPPTSQEIDDFVNDKSQDAWAKVVDRLLASPHYGERWGRRWLDIARYGETRGNNLFGDDDKLPFAFTYRDWVIHSLNEDLPYDKFLLYQLAADRLLLGDDKRPLAALGFLTLGRRSFNGDPDTMDDRIDVTTRGLMGLTVTCARCHDHKFDPVPTKDYYSLYGVFAACREQTLPLSTGTASLASFQAFEKQKQAREEKITQFLAAKAAEMQAHTRAHYADYLQAGQDPLDRANAGGEETISGLKTGLIQRWAGTLKASKGRFDPIFAPWNSFATLPPDKFAAQSGAIAKRFAANAEADKKINPLIAKALAGPPPTSLEATAVRYARVFSAVDLHWQQAVKAAKEKGNPPPKGLADPAEEAIRQMLFDGNGLASIPTEQVEAYLKDADRNRLLALRRTITQLMASPTAPPHALVLEDMPGMPNPRVFVRGNQETPGDEVPRRFLLAIAGEKRQPFKDGSGRLELAQAIATKDNPLTARVLVNRVWLYHFGKAIVGTPSDFGTRGELPTHPELLDWLAAHFVEKDEIGRMKDESNPNSSFKVHPSSFACGWSLKKLHRLILLSSAYQMSDEDNPDNRKADPENRLVWRMNRQRLDFEALRDSLLAASGGLDLQEGGRSVDLTRAPYNRRRTLYGQVDRQNLPSLYRVFDFAGPDAHTAQRYITTSPQQSLFLLNSPFMIEQTRRLAARPELSGLSSPEARIQGIYRLLFGREATAKEVSIGQRFLQTAIARQAETSSRVVSAWQYGYGEVDETTKRVKSFTPLPYWTGEMWQGGAALPDAELGSLQLSAGGGSPGSDLRHAVIRRWTARRDGYLSITGQIAHGSMNGDGIRARIISSRAGELGSWRVRYTVKEANLTGIPVKAGETIDFVADCNGDDLEDTFTWSPILTQTSSPPAGTDPAHKPKFREAGFKWNASADFSGPSEDNQKPLTPWEKYAQILLLSNEFAFVD